MAISTFSAQVFEAYAIADRLPATLLLMGSSLALSLLAGAAFGIYAALRPYSIGDYVITTIAFFGQSMPVFWFALMVQLFFAVDGFNVKLDGLGGSIANRSLYGSQGAVAIPLGGQYGLQIDGAAGNFDNRFFGSTAGHAFWRNPAVGLAGFYSSYTQWNSIVGNVHVAKYGGEGALYLGQWTAEGAAGVESGSNRTATVGTFIDTINVKTRFFDQVSLAYYLNDNLKLSIGHAYTAGRSALTAGGEWSFAAAI